MASRATVHRLSLDIAAASKANDERIKEWARRQSNEHNETKKSGKPKNIAPENIQRKNQYIKKKQNAGLPVEEHTNPNIARQTSKIPLTCLNRYISWRFGICMLLQTSFVVMIFQRFCLPMALECMVKPSSVTSSPKSSFLNRSNGSVNRTHAGHVARILQSESKYGNTSLYNSTQEEDTQFEFTWDSEVQGLMLSSALFASCVAPMLGSFVATRLGGKMTMTLFNLLSTLMTVLTPAAARISPYCLIAARILLGFFTGGSLPIASDYIVWWAPKDETLTMSSLTFTGTNIGNILVTILTGYLCLIPWDNGWPFVFYVIGALSLLWGLAWHFLSSRKPEEHPYISEKEKQYIITNRVGLDSRTSETKPPFVKILTSVPVLAFIICGVCHLWTVALFFNYLPSFFRKRLHFSVQETGLIVSLASIFRLLGSFMWIFIGNRLVPYTGIARSRKICIVVGLTVSGICSLITGFIDDSLKWLATSVLFVIMTAQAVGATAITAVPLDMAPRYAGLLIAVFISLGSCGSISAPLLAAAITPQGTYEQWRIVWIITSSVFIAGALIFLLFGHATLQPWAKPKEDEPPHIVSIFATLGHRFSVMLEAPPLSPVISSVGAFNFSQMHSATALAQVASSSPEIFYGRNLDYIVQSAPIEMAKPLGMTVDSNEEAAGAKCNEGYEDGLKDCAIPKKKRAFSESEIHVLRLTTTDKDHEKLLERKQQPIFYSLTQHEACVVNAGISETVHHGALGVDNEPFQNIPADDERSIQISHL